MRRSTLSSGKAPFPSAARQAPGLEAQRLLRAQLIPHTLAVTTLKALAPGAPVNLEVDLIARYVERMPGASQGVR